MSRRIMKATATQTNTFLYDGWNLIHEEMEAATPASRSYVWGLDLSQSLQGVGGVGGLLCQIQGRDGSLSRPFFSFSDANGNVTDLVDTNGVIVAHYEYDPYGNAVAKSGDQADANPFRFSSKYWDGETGLYYYGYRYYSPGMGRWLSRDPMGEDGGVNLLAFVRNNPAGYVDPLGLAAAASCCCCCVDSLDFMYIGRSWVADRRSGTGFIGEMNYHFQFPMKLSNHSISGSEKPGDCTFEYWEKEKIQEPFPFEHWTTPIDSHTAQGTSHSPGWDWWDHHRQKACPGSDSGSLDDEPGLWAYDRANPRSITKWLRIKLVVKSASGCNCANKEKVIKLKMKMVLINGVPDWDKSSPPEEAWTF